KDRLEVLVVDGISGDGTRAIIESYSKRNPFIRLLDNLWKITPVALNLGITNAKGDVIIWMSAHNRYERDFISRSVTCLMKYGANNVGGIIITLPREDTLVGRAIVACLSYPFGV